tara:strand:+ start:310 stop:696 length:387 start_codon:yes stop_codon:yes gene_type:complete
MKTLLDLLNEIEEKQMTPIDEAETNIVDEIGKFFVVEKPKSKNDKVEDIMFESTVTYFANQVRGGLDEKTVLGIYKDKMSAKNRASEAIKEFETNLKEMEDAMDDFRSAKKEIEEKRKTAAEKVKSLQ